MASSVVPAESLYSWIVPAVAGGNWAITEADGRNAALSIEQRFQELTGTLAGTGGTWELEQARLRGTRLSFTAGGRTWAGTVGDAAIAGENGAWSARRID